MKWMRNPIVVGVLAVLAIGMVVQSLLPVFRGRSRPRAAAVSATPAAVPAPAPTPLSPTSRTAPPGLLASTNGMAGPAESSQIDLKIVQQNEQRWALGTRDPFQIRSVPTKPIYQRAMEVLNLGGIWRQTDSSLAVLNDHIYAAGDTVLRFIIKSIESDRVWVQGPNGREAVYFKSAGIDGTNRLANTTSTPLTNTDFSIAP